MPDELLGLPADTQTALSLIASGVVIPAVTALLARPDIPAKVKRWIPIGLAVIAAVLIVVFRASGAFAEVAMTVITVAAAIVGIAQAVYALMPAQWKALEWNTTPQDKRTYAD